MSSDSANATTLWDTGVGTDIGLRFFSSYLSEEEQQETFDILNNPTQFPLWNIKPKLYGISLPQHSYLYQRRNNNKKNEKDIPGIQVLETLCQRISKDFQCTVDSVYCNRFQDPNHHIQWHQDQYGTHILVLSLGQSTRVIEFRSIKNKNEKKNTTLKQYNPLPGDIYFMSLQYNKQHEHRVLNLYESNQVINSNNNNNTPMSSTNTTNTNNTTTRISLVFFITSPFQMKEYNIINTKDKVYGAINALWS